MKSEFQPNICIPPNHTIFEAMGRENLNDFLLAKKMDESENNIELLLSGYIPINKKLAKKLSHVLGGTPEFWMNLEKQYQETRKRLSEE